MRARAATSQSCPRSGVCAIRWRPPRSWPSDGIDAEVVDIRSLRPLDHETVLESVAKTNRLMVVEEGTRVGGWAANLLGIVAAEGLHDLDDAWILATGDTPAPYSPSLEDAWLPGPAEIAAAVRARLGVAEPS